jgi:hypothetical protein
LQFKAQDAPVTETGTKCGTGRFENSSVSKCFIEGAKNQISFDSFNPLPFYRRDRREHREKKNREGKGKIRRKQGKKHLFLFFPFSPHFPFFLYIFFSSLRALRSRR